MNSPDAITVERSQHGPFERINLLMPHPAGPAQVSVYRLGDTLFDTGSSRVAARLVTALSDTPPRRIVLTHQHEDHVGGIAALRKAYGHLPVHASTTHLPVLATLGPVPPYRESFWGDPEPVLDAIGYDAGARFEAEGVTVEAVATPGHTPGHMALVATTGDGVFALTGDLYTGGRPLNAWYESAIDDLVASCRELTRHGDGLHMLPTHGRTRSDGARRLGGLADFVSARADEVWEAVDALDTRDLWTLAEHCFGPDDGNATLSRGEFSKACFVRAVLEPVRRLPATPGPLPPPNPRHGAGG